MYIVNVNCPRGRGCEKDDFMLILLLKYFEKREYNCSVISQDKYSWYEGNLNRSTITDTYSRHLIKIDERDERNLKLVKEFAHSLDKV